MKVSKLLTQGVVLAAIGGVGQAHALATLDFQDLTCAATQAQCGVENVYSAKGFTLSFVPGADDPYQTGLQAVGKLWQYNIRGTIAVNPNSCNGTVTLVNAKGAAFSMLSIDLAEANGNGPSAVTFVGTRLDGSKVTKAVQLDGKAGWQRVALPSNFTKLKSVVWSQGDCTNVTPHMFDNILLN